MDLYQNIVGHEKITGYLTRLIESGDLPSAMLFHGEPGVGKRTVALETARLLNCTSDREPHCTCKSCLRIRKGEHFDVLSYEPEGKTGYLIAQVRSILERSNRSRVEGGTKVFILDAVDTLTPSGADALLKTLEDGRDHTLFILLTAFKDEVIGTLSGRCLDFYFGPLTEDQVLSTLKNNYPEYPHLHLVSKLAEGSVERAFQYVREDIFGLRQEVLDILSDYPSVQDFRVLKLLNDHEEDHETIARLMHSLLCDLCLVNQGMPSRVRNLDQKSRLISLEKQFGRKSFDAAYEVRRLLDRFGEPVSTGHHVKSTLLNLKHVLAL